MKDGAPGNTLSKTDGTGTTTYNWDFENRLMSVVLPGTGGTVTFKYDSFGRRVQKSSSSGTTNYLYDGNDAAAEVDATLTLLASYSQGAGIDEPLAELRSGTAGFYEQDALGSVTSITGGAGALLNSDTYDSFGNLFASTGSFGNPFQYTGRDNDSETGLRYYRARYYDPAAGRFVSEEPHWICRWRPQLLLIRFKQSDQISRSKREKSYCTPVAVVAQMAHWRGDFDNHMF